MRNYFLTKNEREHLRYEIVAAIETYTTTSERAFLIQTIVRSTWSSVRESYCGNLDGDLITRLLDAWDIDENSSEEDLNEFADNLVSLVGQTNDEGFWSKD